MKFTVSINCKNAAFCESDEPTTTTAAPELARILRKIADDIESGSTFDYFQTIRDANGNDVGRYAMKGA